MASPLFTLLVGICIMVFVPSIWSAKIVGFPMMAGSQYLAMKRIAQELAKRGHQVTIIVNSAQKIKQSNDINHVIYQVPFEKGFMEKIVVSTAIKDGMLAIALFGNATMHAIAEQACDLLLQNTNLLNSFKDYDLIITDCSQFCGAIVADYLGIHRVEYCPAPPRIPFLPSPYEAFLTLSYIPQFMTLNPMRMSFLQRVKNTVMFMAFKLIARVFLVRRFQALKIKYNIKPERNYWESLEDKELTLFMTDFAFEYPQPLRPDYKIVGPVNIQPAQALPPDLQQLLDSSGDDGVIIVSFGSNVASILDKEKVDIMAEAFGRLKQKVIWRLQGYIPSSLSPNIKPVAWLPQSDLLAHEKMRCFVSHAGLNSMYESLYHGVPVVAIPLYGDQPDNAFQMKEQGTALIVDYKMLTVDDLYRKIQQVVNDPSFQKKAQRISRLMQDRPRTPVQEAGDWIEYTLRHGSLAHLRPYSSQLSWYQYFLVDVAVFLVLVVLVVIMVIRYTVRLICWMCCRRTRKQKTQ